MTRTGPRTTTRRNLLRVGVTMVLLTVLTACFAWVAFDRVQHTADTVRADIAPALIEVSAARDALVKAEWSAVASFGTGAAQLSGPGDKYRAQIAIASQNLTQAAAHHIGDDNPQTFELVNTRLAAYSSSIEQAAASYRQNKTTALWVSDLWTASRLLDGVLTQLDSLRDTQVEKLKNLDSGQDTLLSALSWLLPAIALLMLLGVAQVYLRRRFRRTVNVGLALATLCVLGMLALPALAFHTGARIHATRDTVDRQQKGTWNQISELETQRQQRLAYLIRTQCNIEAGECDRTVQQAVHEASPTGQRDATQDKLINGSSEIDNKATAASRNGGYGVLIPIAAVLVIGLIIFGIYVRFDEYRYRSR